jgi:hypothetical protein
MRLLRVEFAGLLAALVWPLACGGPTPVQPAPVPSAAPQPEPTPVPTPTPTPTPSPAPPSCSTCEAPVSNTNPVVRLTLRLYSVETPYGEPKFNFDPERGIPVEWIARLDVVGRDYNDDETNGQGDIEFHFSDPSLVKVSGGHTHQRRLRVLEPGELTCWVTQDGVRSNNLILQLVP